METIFPLDGCRQRFALKNEEPKSTLFRAKIVFGLSIE
jgi:hypothetical protein